MKVTVTLDDTEVQAILIHLAATPAPTIAEHGAERTLEAAWSAAVNEQRAADAAGAEPALTTPDMVGSDELNGLAP